MPELYTPGGDKRDHRADVTYLCGLLLFVMTGEAPRILRDPEGRKPHQRQSICTRLAHVDDDASVALANIFAVEFEYEVARRWQSARVLLDALARTHTAIVTDADAGPPRIWLPIVECNWQINVDDGRLDSVYMECGPREQGEELQGFFVNGPGAVPLTGAIEEAARIVFDEVRPWIESHPQIDGNRPYRRVWDRLIHHVWSDTVLDERSAGQLYWRRILKRPGNDVAGPLGELSWKDARPTLQATMRILDAEALRHGKLRMEQAVAKKRAWDADD